MEVSENPVLDGSSGVAPDTTRSQPSQSLAVKVRDEGLTELSPGKSPVVDIVFIHGLQGHPKRTWTWTPHATGSNDSILGNRWMSFLPYFATRTFYQNESSSASSAVGSPEVFWPFDLLAKTFPQARILTYGYDSHVSRFFQGPANQNNIYAHGQDLLNALERSRRKSSVTRMPATDPDRPIIFIAHSLGGIVLKSCLYRSRNAPVSQEHLRSIYEKTHAIIFLGTPHRGSLYAPWAQIARNAAVSAGLDANDTILHDLKIDSSVLEMLRDAFTQMVDEKIHLICSFQESKGLMGFRGLNNKVVEDFSSGLDHPFESREHINADHQSLCRYASEEDEGYQKVFGALSRFLVKLEKRKDEDVQKRVAQCLADLVLPGLDARCHQVEPPHEATFEWLWLAQADGGPGFLEWLYNSHSLYWIQGKPGCGKSTIMKYVSSKLRSREYLPRLPSPWIIVSFFFHDRGPEIQKSLTGLLRSILYHILSDEPRFIHSIWPVLYAERHLPGKTLSGTSNDWTVAELKSALSAVTRSEEVTANICMFVDALDELDGSNQDHAKMVSYFKELCSLGGKRINLKVCVASRPYNIFRDQFDGCAGLSLHKLTAPDILKYVNGHLSMHPGIQDTLIQEKVSLDFKQLAQNVVDRANGVFLWVRLVVEELVEGLTEGASISELKRTLWSLPQDLEELFLRILSRVKVTHRIETYIMLHAVLFAGDPLSPADFWYVIQKNLEIEGDCSTWTLERLERRVKSRCGGLIEFHEEGASRSLLSCDMEFRSSPSLLGSDNIRSSKSYIYRRPGLGSHIVQFCHQTVKDFVSRRDNLKGLIDLDPTCEKTGCFWMIRDANYARDRVESVLRYGWDVNECMEGNLPRDYPPEPADPASHCFYPLHAVAMVDDEVLVQVLLDHGAKVQARDSVGRTTLHVLLQHCRKRLVACLARRGAKITLEMVKEIVDKLYYDWEETELLDCLFEEDRFYDSSTWEPESLAMARKRLPRRLRVRGYTVPDFLQGSEASSEDEEQSEESSLSESSEASSVDDGEGFEGKTQEPHYETEPLDKESKGPDEGARPNKRKADVALLEESVSSKKRGRRASR